MKKKRLRVHKLSEGMILFNDVCTENGQLVVNGGTVLNQYSIDRLHDYNIDSVLISIPDEDNINNSTSTNFVRYVVKPKTHLQRIRESKEFEQFHKIYFTHMKNFETHLNDIANSNATTIDIDTLLAAPTALVNNVDTTFAIFDLLLNIRHLDDSTYAHSLNVSIIASIVGKWLHLSEQDQKILTSCGLLHDIGKLLIPPEVLQKPGKLTPEEFELIKQHTTYGYTILKDKELDPRIKASALLHHEKADGSGYPLGKKRESLPFFSQIITIVDTYEAMTANRVYRDGLCPFKVIKLYEEEGFTKYNVQILMTFVEKLVQTYIGYTVRLSDGRIGKIVYINRMDLSHPVIECGNTFIDLARERTLEIETLL